MRALVIEHDRFSTPERVGDHLERRGVILDPLVVVEDFARPAITAEFPSPGDHELVVIMGSPWSVYEPQVQGWVRPEVDLVRNLLRREIPVLGICFGAQIMSASLGGEVFDSPRPEYGWHKIESDEAAISPGPWFHYHHDEFTLPDGAAPLARSGSTVQAFRYGRSLGVQFHPEVTGALLEGWCSVGGDRSLIEAGIDPDDLISETREQAAASQPALERMLDWFLGEVAG